MRVISLRLAVVACLVLFVLGMSVVAVHGTTNQGLEWGVDPGQRFDYAVNFEFSVGTQTLRISGSIYIIVGTLHEIADPVIHISELTAGVYSTYWENDTEFDVELPIMTSPVFYLVPIGNWTLVTELHLDEYGDTITTGETDSAWWFEGTNAAAVVGTMRWVVEIVKSDGALGYMYYSNERPDDQVSLTMEVIRADYEPQSRMGLPPLVLMSLIGVGVLAVVAIGVVILRRR